MWKHVVKCILIWKITVTWKKGPLAYIACTCLCDNLECDLVCIVPCVNQIAWSCGFWTMEATGKSCESNTPLRFWKLFLFSTPKILIPPVNCPKDGLLHYLLSIPGSVSLIQNMDSIWLSPVVDEAIEIYMNPIISERSIAPGWLNVERCVLRFTDLHETILHHPLHY